MKPEIVNEARSKRNPMIITNWGHERRTISTEHIHAHLKILPHKTKLEGLYRQHRWATPKDFHGINQRTKSAATCHWNAQSKRAIEAWNERVTFRRALETCSQNNEIEMGMVEKISIGKMCLINARKSWDRANCIHGFRQNILHQSRNPEETHDRSNFESSAYALQKIYSKCTILDDGMLRNQFEDFLKRTREGNGIRDMFKSSLDTENVVIRVTTPLNTEVLNGFMWNICPSTSFVECTTHWRFEENERIGPTRQIEIELWSEVRWFYWAHYMTNDVLYLYIAERTLTDLYIHACLIVHNEGR